MNISAWLTVSDLVSIRQTFLEKIIAVFFESDRKSMYKSMSIDRIIASFKKAGINGFELLVPSLTSDENIQEIKEIMSKNKFSVNSIHQSLTSLISITLAEIERLCLIANIFSAKIIVLHAGAIGNKLSDNVFIQKLKTLQKKYQITFGVENMPPSPFSIYKKYTYEKNAFTAAVRSTGLSMTLDTTHLAHAGGNIIEFFLENKNRIVNIHLSDYKSHWLNKKLLLQNYTHLPLHNGELPIKQFLKTLKKENYQGAITLEINTNLRRLCESGRIIRLGLR